MKNKIWSILHLFILVLIIWWNYYVNSGQLNGKEVGEVSDKLNNLFTPASYAFSIWGLIYLSLFALSCYSLYVSFKEKDQAFIGKSLPYLSLAHISSGVWLYLWSFEMIGFSVIAMLGILFFLITVVVKLNMEKWDVPVRLMAFVWWPIDLYFGWISVATIANIAAYLTFIEWDPIISELSWTIIVVAVAGVLGFLLIKLRNMREYAAVIVWGLVAVAVANWETNGAISGWCIIVSIILLVQSVLHANRNKETLPHKKIARGEW